MICLFAFVAVLLRTFFFVVVIYLLPSSSFDFVYMPLNLLCFIFRGYLIFFYFSYLIAFNSAKIHNHILWIQFWLLLLSASKILFAILFRVHFFFISIVIFLIVDIVETLWIAFLRRFFENSFSKNPIRSISWILHFNSFNTNFSLSLPIRIFSLITLFPLQNYAIERAQCLTPHQIVNPLRLIRYKTQSNAPFGLLNVSKP